MNDQDNLDQQLGRALHRQADPIGGTPISFEAVKGTARGIRRRRALAATAAVAAAVAIIVPTAIVGSDLLAGSPSKDSTQIATQNTTGDPTGNVTGRDELDARNLETGDAPGLVWIDGGVLHDGDRELQVKGPYDSVAALGDRYVATGQDTEGGGRIVAVLDEQGAATATYPLSGGLATNAAHSIVAWMSPDGAPQVLQDGLDEPLRMADKAGLNNYNTVGVTGNDCTTDAETTDAGGCSVEFTADDDQGMRSSYSSSSHGFADFSAPEGHVVTAVSPTGGAIEITEVRDDGTCSMARAMSGDELWTTCDYRGSSYSADGSKLLAVDGYGDSIGEGRLAILDAADGTPLLDLLSTQEAPAFYNNAVWEDDSHVLASVYQDGQWSVVRFGLDGSREYAVAPQPGGDTDTPFFFATQP